MKPTWTKVYGPPFDPAKQERRVLERLHTAWVGMFCDPPGYFMGLKLDALYVKYRDFVLAEAFGEETKRQLNVPNRFMKLTPN